ncbi:YeeE/YedE family protein [Microdochium nivale]|nr:YeeE/YedE family protein [Microdochium nivale]
MSPTPSTTTSVLTGSIFGAGLALSGVASPQVIKDQFRLQDFHMLATFLTASATSAVVFAVYNQQTAAAARHNGPNMTSSSTSRSKIAPRPAKSFGPLGPVLGAYGGNVVGGAMVGLGMAVTGACPGTVLVQAVAGAGRSRLLALSAVLVGVVWTRWGSGGATPAATAAASERRQPPTVMSATGWSTATVVLAYEAAVLAVLGAILVAAPRSSGPLLHPVAGGLVIGLGQLASVVLTGKAVGVSAVYADCGRMLLLRRDAVGGVPDSVAFAGGLAAGAWAVMLRLPAVRAGIVAGAGEQSLPAIIAGGFLLVVGARVAGGCTSGHGISGMAALGLSSFVTVISMFGTALVAGLMLS